MHPQSACGSAIVLLTIFEDLYGWPPLADNSRSQSICLRHYTYDHPLSMRAVCKLSDKIRQMALLAARSSYVQYLKTRSCPVPTCINRVLSSMNAKKNPNPSSSGPRTFFFNASWVRDDWDGVKRFARRLIEMDPSHKDGRTKWWATWQEGRLVTAPTILPVKPFNKEVYALIWYTKL
jgi:hypothetical protein